MNKFGMTYVKFEDDLEALEKLKVIGLFTKTKTVAALNQIVYKDIEDNNVRTYPCKVLGYSWKDTPSKSINSIYENLRINANDREFDINLDFLKDMQKKSWGTENQLDEN